MPHIMNNGQKSNGISVCRAHNVCPLNYSDRFKLHLRPKQSTNEKNREDDAIPPLPSNKKVEDILADYLQYLNRCAMRFIEYAHGAEMWESLSSSLNPAPDSNGRYPKGQGVVYILSHPNGWEGYHQQIYSNSAVKGGLLPADLDSLQERLHFVTEGEASLHWAYQTLGSSASMKVGTLTYNSFDILRYIDIVAERNRLYCN